jgi:hypothetical protein
VKFSSYPSRFHVLEIVQENLCFFFMYNCHAPYAMMSLHPLTSYILAFLYESIVFPIFFKCRMRFGSGQCFPCLVLIFNYVVYT